MDLLQILRSQVSDEMLAQMSREIGAAPEQTASATNGIFATLLGGLANNAQSPDGMSSLLGALDRDHDGSILDDVVGMLGGVMAGQAAPSSSQNGLGILGHILGGRQEAAAQQISQSSGLNIGQIMRLMPILAPIVMAVLGKIRRSGQVTDQGMSNILTGSAQQAAENDGMGDLLSTVLGTVLSGGRSQQSSGVAGDLIGSVLGGIFGRR